MFDKDISEGDIVEIEFEYDNMGKIKIALDILSANIDKKKLMGKVVMSEGVPFNVLDNEKLIMNFDEDMVVNTEDFRGYHFGEGIGSNIKILST